MIGSSYGIIQRRKLMNKKILVGLVAGIVVIGALVYGFSKNSTSNSQTGELHQIEKENVVDSVEKTPESPKAVKEKEKTSEANEEVKSAVKAKAETEEKVEIKQKVKKKQEELQETIRQEEETIGKLTRILQEEIGKMNASAR